MCGLINSSSVGDIRPFGGGCNTLFLRVDATRGSGSFFPDGKFVNQFLFFVAVYYYCYHSYHYYCQSHRTRACRWISDRTIPDSLRDKRTRDGQLAFCRRSASSSSRCHAITWAPEGPRGKWPQADLQCRRGLTGRNTATEWAAKDGRMSPDDRSD